MRGRAVAHPVSPKVWITSISEVTANPTPYGEPSPQPTGCCFVYIYIYISIYIYMSLYLYLYICRLPGVTPVKHRDGGSPRPERS